MKFEEMIYSGIRMPEFSESVSARGDDRMHAASRATRGRKAWLPPGQALVSHPEGPKVQMDLCVRPVSKGSQWSSQGQEGAARIQWNRLVQSEERDLSVVFLSSPAWSTGGRGMQRLSECQPQRGLVGKAGCLNVW